jgi:hypothetical protein
MTKSERALEMVKKAMLTLNESVEQTDRAILMMRSAQRAAEESVAVAQMAIRALAKHDESMANELLAQLHGVVIELHEAIKEE